VFVVLPHTFLYLPLLFPQLPVTLLYDYQSVGELVQYINETLTAGAELAAAAAESGAAAGAEEAGSDSDVEDITGAAQRQPRGGASQDSAADDGKPSQLLKTLRLAPPERPLFLAAPGVANAQSAYFSFSQFLQASSAHVLPSCCPVGT
jgi:hypothetical protein